MSVTPISPVTPALPSDISGPTQSALNALVETVAAAETAVLLELAAPDLTPPGKTTPTPANPVAQAVDAARTTAAVRQGSLAPLFADLTQAAASPALPPALRAAVSQVLALQLPTDAPVTAETLKQAVSQSGLFLEAHLAAAPANASAPPLDLKGALLVLQRALAAIAAPSPPEATATEAATTPADRPATPAPATPPPTGAAQAANAPITSAALRQAVAQSGPFLEAHLANPATPAAAAPADLKAALAVLQRALAATPAGPAPSPGAPPVLPAPLRAAVIQLVAEQLPANGPFTAPAIRQAVAQAAVVLEAHLANPAPLPEDAPPVLRDALRSLQRAAAGPAASTTPDAAAPASPEVRAPVPPPPHRQAAPTAQPAARASLPADAEPAAIVQHLKGQVAQAVARQTLHQLASLPDGRAPAWMFELPLATPQGAALAQFVVDRDPEGSAAAADQAPAWRARFSIDVEPLGPVHVHLRMAGDQTAVTVWAERPESLEQLRSEGVALARALPAEVTFRRGAPPRQPAPASGRFIDQTS
jgi:hypothetical protein